MMCHACQPSMHVPAMRIMPAASCTPARGAPARQDVTTFLAWAAEPEHDERKLMGAKWIFVLAVVWVTAAYYKRWKWAPLKSRRIVVDALN